MTTTLATRRRGAVGATAASAVLALLVPEAHAAPYLASCTSGVLAPQVCTFAASAVVAGFAAPGQHLVLTRVAPGSPAQCPDGRLTRVEQYRGLLRGKERVDAVTLRLDACPGLHPSVRVETESYRNGVYGVTASVEAPRDAGAPAGFGFYEGNFNATMSRAAGTIFRRDTGMASYPTGTSEECGLRNINGMCEMGRADYGYSVRVDSSISGHWARLQLAIRSDSRDVETRTVRVTAVPYGNGGWKITRVA